MNQSKEFYHVDIVQLEIGGVDFEAKFDFTNIVSGVLSISIGNKEALENSVTVWNDCNVEVDNNGNVGWVANLNDGGKKISLNKHI